MRKGMVAAAMGVLLLIGCQKEVKQYQHGHLIYDGTVDSYGMRDGKGKLYSVDGILIYEGEFSQNIPNGKGVQYDLQTGKMAFKGLFRNGLILRGTQFDKNGTNPHPYQE